MVRYREAGQELKMFPAFSKTELLSAELMLLSGQRLLGRLTEIGNMVKQGELTPDEYNKIYLRASRHIEDEVNALHFEDPADDIEV
jgi:hypothetical protein